MAKYWCALVLVVAFLHCGLALPADNPETELSVPEEDDFERLHAQLDSLIEDQKALLQEINEDIEDEDEEDEGESARSDI